MVTASKRSNTMNITANFTITTAQGQIEARVIKAKRNRFNIEYKKTAWVNTWHTYGREDLEADKLIARFKAEMGAI
jgi:hypothetical protein